MHDESAGHRPAPIVVKLEAIDFIDAVINEQSLLNTPRYLRQNIRQGLSEQVDQLHAIVP